MLEEESDEDPVVKEIDVRVSQSLSKKLVLLQYPLRPSHMLYPSESVLSSHVCSNGDGVKFEMKVRPRGDNYSSSKGLYYARMVNLGAGEEQGSDLWDHVTLSSESLPNKATDSGCYAAAVLRDGCLHLTPLKTILQLRPSLSYLDTADVGIKRSEAGITCGANSGGDTTESEGEESRPVMVRFSKPGGAGKSQRKVGHKKSFTETKQSLKSDQSWARAEFFGMETEEAEEERRLLMAGADNQNNLFGLSEEQYLDVIFPCEGGKKEDVTGTNGPTSGGASNSHEKVRVSETFAASRGSTESGQPPVKHTENPCHAAIKELFQKNQKIRKDQVIELMESQGKTIHTKEVANALKELCQGKGGYWMLK